MVEQAACSRNSSREAANCELGLAVALATGACRLNRQQQAVRRRSKVVVAG